MAIPTAEVLDAMIYGAGISIFEAGTARRVPLQDFFFYPEPGERDVWQGRIFLPPEPYDDGGGAAIAAYRYGACPFFGTN